MREYDAENSNSQIFCVVYVNCVVGCLSLFIFGHFFSVLFSLLCIFSMKIESIFFQFSFDLFGLTICCECEWIISIYKRWLSWRKNVRLRRKKEFHWKTKPRISSVDLISLDFVFLMHRRLTISHCVHAAVNKIVHFVVKTTREKEERERENHTKTKWRSHSKKNLGNWTVRRQNKVPVRWLWSQEKASKRAREKVTETERKSNRETHKRR